MYNYRAWSEPKRLEALRERRSRGFPTHSPGHPEVPEAYRLITAACFEHRAHLNTSERRDWFENNLLKELDEHMFPCSAWVILPNHYHILLKIDSIDRFGLWNKQFHGRTSRQLNLQDKSAGRQNWYKYSDRIIRSERHFYTTLNYIHNNPIKHRYVHKWGDWKQSSFHSYLNCYGREWLIDIWREHPLMDYGKGWDE